MPMIPVLTALNFTIYRRSAMPRRPAKVTQADIARAIRAAKEAGAGAVMVDGEGIIRIELTEAPRRSSLQMIPAKYGCHLRHCSVT